MTSACLHQGTLSSTPRHPAVRFVNENSPGLLQLEMSGSASFQVNGHFALCHGSQKSDVHLGWWFFFTQKTWGRFVCQCCWLILLQWVEISTYSYCLCLRVLLVLLMDKMLHQLVTTAFRQSKANIKDPRPPSRILKNLANYIKLLGILMPSTHWMMVHQVQDKSVTGFPTPTWWGLDKISLKSMWTQWVYYFRKVASVVPSQQNMLCRDMMETTWTRVRLVLTWHSWDTWIFQKKVGPHGWRMVKVDVASSLGV